MDMSNLKRKLTVDKNNRSWLKGKFICNRCHKNFNEHFYTDPEMLWRVEPLKKYCKECFKIIDYYAGQY